MAEQYTLKVVFEGDSSGLGKSAKSAENILSGFSSKISKLGESISGIGSKLTSSITKPALAAATALTSITLVKGWNRMTAIDDARIKLKALGLTAEEVSGVSEKALASVKGTAYGMDEAMTVASTAFAAGVTDMTDMERYLGNIADTAAVAGSSMEEIGSIFNKITTNGKATNETLQQLSDRGLPVYQWLAEEAGVASDAIWAMASSGEISMSMLQNAIETHIDGAAKTIGSKTIKGAISNLWASISRIGANFLGSADDVNSFAGKVLPMLNTLTDKLGGVEEKAKEWSAVFGEVFGYLYDYISTGSTNMDGLSDSAQRIIGKFQEISAAVTGWKATITGAVSGVVNKFGPLRSLVDLVKSKFSEMGITGKAGLAGLAIAAGPVTSALGKVVTVAGNIGSVIGNLNIVDKFTGAVSGIGTAASKISEFERKIINLDKITAGVKSGFSSFGSVISGSVNGMLHPVETLKSGFTGLGNGASKVGNVISSGFTSALNMAKNPITTLKSGLSGLASGFTTLATSPAGVITIIGLLVAAFVRLWNTSETFRNSITGIVNTLKSTLGPVLEEIQATVTTMLETIKPAIDELLTAMEPVVTTIVELFATLVSTAMPVISQIISLVSQIVTVILPPLLSIISSLQPVIAAVLSAVQTALPSIMTIINSVVSVISTIITVLSPIITFVSQMISKIISYITPVITVVSTTISYIVECISNFKENVCIIFEAIGEFFGNVFESIGNVASTIWDTVKSVWDAATGFFSDLFNGIKDTVDTVFGAIGDFITSIFDGVEDAWDGLKAFASGVCDGITTAFDSVASVVKGVINGVIAAINGAIWAINLIPGVEISKIDYLARGTDDWKGGFAVINEYGKGELVNLPNGSQVIPHDISMEYARESARVNNEGMGTERATEEIILSINNYVDVDGTQLNVRAYNYTVDAISSQQRAISIAKGETY